MWCSKPFVSRLPIMSGGTLTSHFMKNTGSMGSIIPFCTALCEPKKAAGQTDWEKMIGKDMCVFAAKPSNQNETFAQGFFGQLCIDFVVFFFHNKWFEQNAC